MVSEENVVKTVSICSYPLQMFEWNAKCSHRVPDANKTNITENIFIFSEIREFLGVFLGSFVPFDIFLLGGVTHAVNVDC